MPYLDGVAAAEELRRIDEDIFAKCNSCYLVNLRFRKSKQEASVVTE